MTTNELFFFRDKIPFEHFRDTIMPALLAARAAQRRIRIWCAAASTGQEPYSLAMASEGDGRQQLPAGASRSSPPICPTRCWKRRKAGIYSQFEVQRGLPIQLLVKYFTQIGETWQIAPDIRAMVQFRPLNLLARLLAISAVRRRVLPQRADLFRPGDQDRRARPHRAHASSATAIWCSAPPRPWSA